MSLEDNDIEDGEVISVEGEATDTGPEDRGDNLAEPIEVEAEEVAEEVHEERKPSGIPKARFDEVNEAKKAAQAELEEAKAEIERLRAATTPKPQATQATPAPSNFDDDAAEQAYIDAMLDGDSEKARAIRREINAHLRAQAVQDFETSQTSKSNANALQAESQASLESYPYLDTPDGEFALELIVAARNKAIAAGVAPHIALRDAVAKIAPKFNPDGEAPSRDLPAAKTQADTRTQEALRRGAADSLRQPPAVQAGIGNRTTQARVEVDKLDEDQFANLSNAEKKRLRGD